MSTAVPPDDPTFFPAAFDATAGTLSFCRAERRTLSEAAFLDDRFVAGAESLGAIAAATLSGRAAADTTPAAPAFVLHTAFCCSTLISRCLDLPGINLSLREPGVLMDLANALRMVPPERRPAVREALAVTVGLLARGHAPGERILVKPTNAATSLYASLLEVAPDARAVLLFSGLRAFLVSVLKKGEAGRHFVRALYNIFALDGTGLSRIPARQAMAFTDLQVAALVWRHQVESFQGLLDALPGERLHVLDGDRFLADPRAALGALCGFLRLDVDDETLDAVATGPALARDAKFDDQAFDVGTRRSEARAVESRWGTELDLICGWAGPLVLDRPVDPRFTAP
ncbi:MAG TPA: hypothetical protein VLA56_06600 [Pseudomonadales bacterium]|nr:hypothetical protein [Pseudomonadales bacterium]